MSSKHQSLGDRMKRYEAAHQYTLTPRSCLFVKVDGRSFHNFTRDCDRPFDRFFMEAMVEAAYAVSQEMQGFKGAYIQSDEVTFMLADFDSHETQGWFGYKLNKIVSISASLMTAYFLVNYYRLMRMIDLPPRPPVFDSRAFIVPIDDAPNVFIWRQQDWMRNSVQMLARANFSHKALDGKGISDMHDMLHRKGINWATDCSPRERNGTFMFGRSFLSEKLDYDRLEIYLGLLREHKNA